jgi:hypothetical protein
MTGCERCVNKPICGGEINPHGMNLVELKYRQTKLQDVTLQGENCGKKVYRLLATVTNAIRAWNKREKQKGILRAPKLPGSRKKRVFNSWE